MIIYLFGMDGSGKTTLAELVMSHFKNEGAEFDYKWLRYNHYFTKIFLALGRLFGFTEIFYEKGKVRYKLHHFEKFGVFKWIYIFFQVIDVNISYFLNIYLPLIRKRNIICDRYIYDILIDLSIDIKENLLDTRLVENLFKRLIPVETKMFKVEAAREDLLARRAENALERHFDRRFEYYSSIKDKNVICVNTTTTATEEILKTILDEVSKFK